MTQAKKASKGKPKSASNFIKLDSQNADNEVHEEENSEPIIKHKNIISGSKEAIKTRGVIYMSHLPHGFFENQLRKYLEQVILNSLRLITLKKLLYFNLSCLISLEII